MYIKIILILDVTSFLIGHDFLCYSSINKIFSLTVTSRRLKSQFWGLYTLFLIKLYEMTVIIFLFIRNNIKNVMHTEHAGYLVCIKFLMLFLHKQKKIMTVIP